MKHLLLILAASAALAAEPKSAPTDAEIIMLLKMKVQALEQVNGLCEANRAALDAQIAKPAAEAVARVNQYIKMLSDKCPSGKLDQDAKCVAVDPKK